MIRSGKTPWDLEMPWITLLARDYIKDYLGKLPRAETRVFEYGTGGSGLFFLQFASTVVSVEHDAQWYSKVSERANQLNQDDWQVILAEPEPLGNHAGRHDPSDPDGYRSADPSFLNKNFRNYVTKIDSFPDSSFDVVLVDGRSRPSCLRHGAPKVKRNGLLVLDNAERSYYLERKPLPDGQFTLVHSSMGALVGSPQLTRTNIYIRNQTP